MIRALLLTGYLFIAGGLAIAQRPAAPASVWSFPAPAGFRTSKSLNGYEDSASGAFIILNPLGHSSPGIMRKMFTDSTLKRHDMTLQRIDSIEVSGTPTALYISSQKAKGKTFLRMTMLLEHPDGSMLVTAGYPAGATVDTASIMTALRHIERAAASGEPEDPLASAPFRIDPAGTEFKPVKYAGGSLLLSTDGKTRTAPPVFIAANSLGKSEISSRKAFAEKRLHALPGAATAIIRESKEITIDGLPGYELVAESKRSDGIPVLHYLAVLYHPNGNYFVMVGRASERTDAMLRQYRLMANSYRQKK